MELSKFLQQDIMEFLEQKSSEQREKLGSLRSEEFTLFDVDRDYAKETTEALENNNQGKAKKIFDELREAYNSLGEKDVEEREKIYAILEEVYAKIKEGIENSTSLADDLKDFEEHAFKNVPPPPSKQAGGEQPPLPDDEETRAFEEAALKAQEERKKEEQAMREAEEAVSQAVQRKDVQAAAKAYNTLKHEFSTYPSDDKFRKVEWYNHVLAAYEQVKRLQAKQAEEHKKRQVQEEEDRKKQEEEERKQRAVQDHLRLVKGKMRDLIRSLDDSDVHAAESLLIDARHLVAKLGDETEKEKQGLESILSTVTHRIQFLKRKQADEQRRQREAEERRRREEAERQEREAAAKRAAEEERKRQEEERRKKSFLAKAKGNAEALYQEGLRYQYAGDNEKAEACFKEILRISPHHLPAQIRLEQLRQGQQREEAQAP